VFPSFIVFAAIWTATWFVPATYRSETLILVEQPKVPTEYVVSNVADDLQQRLQSMTQQILSRTRLISVIEQFNLYSNDRDKSNVDDLVERMRKDIQIELVRETGRELSAFKIAYISRNAHTAQAVTAQLSSLFIDENLRVRQQQSENTTEFLDSELEQARHSLSEQEVRVREFKSRYLGELPGQSETNVQILTGLQTRLQQEMEALAHARQQKVYLESMVTQLRTVEAGLQSSGTTPAAPTIDQEINQVQSHLADLQSRYNDQHPDVQATKARLEKLRQLQAQRDARAAEEAKENAVGDKPIRAGSLTELQAMAPRLQIESELKANSVEIENRQRAIKTIEGRIDAMQGRLNLTPLREQQLADLTRDYDQSRRNYEQLLAKRDQSSMATTLEKRQEGEQFRVVDPANLPQAPYSPNRPKLALFAVLGGLLCGGMCLARYVISDDTFLLREEVSQAVEASVLVEVPPIHTADEVRIQRRRASLKTAAFVAMGLLTTAGMAVSFYLR
jgi:polysaccharide chain length determinant protein (PEP-CTERM system associated)